MHLQDQDRTTCGLTHSVVRVDHVKISCPRNGSRWVALRLPAGRSALLTMLRECNRRMQINPSFRC